MIELRQHQGLADRWLEGSLAFWMLNIGSEVSRTIKNINNKARAQGSFDRALELIDLTIYALQQRGKNSAIRELCYVRDELCSYFYGGEIVVDVKKMQKYYDQFTTMIN